MERALTQTSFGERVIRVMNIQLSKSLIERLSQLGVRQYMVCAGARNAPLVKVLGHSANLMTQHFYDERAAAFFALGRAKRDNEPVAIVTTSGTAVAELLSAVVEAYYSGVPLVLITADRPQRYRGSGAPQSIEQVGIFSHYVGNQFDIFSTEQVLDLKISHLRSTHVNVCFDEPLLDEALPQEPYLFESKVSECLVSKASTEAEQITSEKMSSAQVLVDSFLKSAKRPIVVLGSISKDVRSGVFETLLKLKLPIYAEGPSGLREAIELSPYVIKNSSALLSKKNFHLNFDSVIRIGSVPTLRLWRDLENELANVPVISVSHLPFSGLARSQNTVISYQDFFNLFVGTNTLFETASTAFISTDTLFEKKLTEYPQSELAWVRVVSENIPQGSTVMLGNSLPIREWDQAATFKNRNLNVIANRGANGIDGLISTFLGAAEAKKENWLILGDLSALYDLNALSLLRAVDAETILRIVILNNYGGQIFKPMFRDKNFINEHQLDFSKWAEMFNVNYMKLTKVSHRKRFKQLNAEATIIEIQPDAAQSEECWGLT